MVISNLSLVEQGLSFDRKLITKQFVVLRVNITDWQTSPFVIIGGKEHHREVMSMDILPSPKSSKTMPVAQFHAEISHNIQSHTLRIAMTLGSPSSALIHGGSFMMLGLPNIGQGVLKNGTGSFSALSKLMPPKEFSMLGRQKIYIPLDDAKALNLFPFYSEVIAEELIPKEDFEKQVKGGIALDCSVCSCVSNPSGAVNFIAGQRKRQKVSEKLAGFENELEFAFAMTMQSCYRVKPGQSQPSSAKVPNISITPPPSIKTLSGIELF